MRFLLIIWCATSILVSAARAEIQISSGSEYGTFSITGGSGYYNLYLRTASADISPIANQGSDVQVTDLGVNANQNHIFRITGSYGDLFQVNNYGWAIELLNSSMSRIGVYSDELDPIFHADAGGPYIIGPGQSATFDAGLSYIAKNHGWNPGANSPDSIGPISWKIDGKSVGSAASFESLTDELGLEYGMHTASLDATAWVDFGEFMPFEGSAVTTLEIVPEPATILLFGLGGIFSRKIKAKK